MDNINSHTYFYATNTYCQGCKQALGSSFASELERLWHIFPFFRDVVLVNDEDEITHKECDFHFIFGIGHKLVTS